LPIFLGFHIDYPQKYWNNENLAEGIDSLGKIGDKRVRRFIFPSQFTSGG